MENKPVSCKSLGTYYGINGKLLEEHYAFYLSGFMQWEQFDHAQDWILFPDYLGMYLSNDETSLSDGELYTVIIQ